MGGWRRLTVVIDIASVIWFFGLIGLALNASKSLDALILAFAGIPSAIGLAASWILKGFIKS